MDTTSRMHGTVRWATDPDTGRGVWVVDAVPHVAIKVKRLLPRVRQTRGGAVAIVDNPEVARDIEWLLQRYPMRMDPASQARLVEQANRHRHIETDIEEILAGRRLPDGARRPARTPYPEQLKSADLAITTGRLLVTDEVGIGKSLTALLVLRAPDSLPALVVTLAHLPRQWIEKELAATFPDLRGHVISSTKIYDPGEVDVLAISYSKLAAWSDHLAGKVNTVVFDEIQELRHQGTDKYAAAGRIADGATYKVGLSATPVYNYGGECFNIINILAPDELGSRDEFLREWGTEVVDGKIRVKNPRAFGEHLRAEGLMLGHTRDEVGRPLPKPLLATQNVDADEDVYDRIAGDAVEMARFVLNKANNPHDRWRAAGEMDMRLRQATGVAKAPYVAAFCQMLLESGTERLVLWGWHRAVFDVWTKLLAPYQPALYTGSETAAAKQRSADSLIDGRSRVLIMSLRSGAGLDGLQMGCDTGVFGELDWSPQVHVQCMGRLARDGIDHAPRGFFCVSDHGADPPMAELLDLKRMQNDAMVNPRANPVQPAAANDGHIRALAESLIARAEQDPAA